MTTYRGTVTIFLSGEAQGYGPFSAGMPVAADLLNATLTPDGTLWATLVGNGTLAVTVGGQTVNQFLMLDSQSFNTPINDPKVPFGAAVPGLAIAWSETTAFDAARLSVTTNGSGTFSGVLSGISVSGTISASGTLAASSAAYSIVAGAAVVEGDAGTSVVSFTVTRLGATVGAGSIGWTATGMTADGAIATDFKDFTMPQGVLSFAPGEVSKTLSVEVLGDDLVEGDETFTVTLANDYGEVISVQPAAVGRILNDDVSLVSVAATTADVAEGAVGAETAFSFTVRRTGNVATPAAVDWAVAGAAVTGADFAAGVLPSGRVEFLAGEASATVTVFVAGDAAAEGHEAFEVVLANPSAGVVGVGRAGGLIINDDGGSAQVADSMAADERFAMGDGGDLVRFSAGRAAYQIGLRGNEVRVQGPDGADALSDVEWVKFGTEPAITLETLRGQPETVQLMRFLTTGAGGTQEVLALPTRYAGPLDLAYVYPGTDSDDTVAGTTLNDFINLAGGNDAADMGAGRDIIDGGGGSNFLTGGAGSDQFFIDGRFAVPVWSCLTDWEIGESLTIWGWTPGVSVGAWGENAGLPGYLGATFFADIDGSGAVETVVTFTGRTVAEMPAAGLLDVGGIGVLKFG